MWKILKYSNQKEFLLFLMAVFLMIFTSAIDILQPTFFSWMVLEIQKTNISIGNVLSLSGIMIGSVIIGVILNLIAIFSITAASIALICRVRLLMFNHVSRLSTNMIEGVGISSMVVRTTNDLFQIRESIHIVFTLAIRAPVYFIVGSIMSVYQIYSLGGGFDILGGKQYLLTLSFLIIPASLGFSFTMIWFARKSFLKQRTYTDENNQIMLENLAGGRVIRAFNIEKNQENRFSIVNNNLRKASKRGETSINALIPIILFSGNLATVVINIVFIMLTKSLIETGTPESFIEVERLGILIQTFTQYFAQILLGFILMASAVFTVERARPSMKRVNEIFSIETSIKDGKSTQKIKNGSIEFKDVSFKFHKESEKIKNTLSKISFKLDAGKTLGIIGQTGSGKTTLVNMISRFYDPDKGQVLIDGIDIKNLQLSNLYKGISVAFQDKVLFKGTIKSNILVGKINATNSEIIEASKNAEAYEFILKKDKKFNSDVERGGTNLSGGQKQRLSIARALIKKPKILVFDDSLSALDNITEEKLLRNIKNNLKGTTLVIVAQRIKSIQNANLIIVLENGCISGMGTHDELLKNNSLYRQISDSQNTEIGG